MDRAGGGDVDMVHPGPGVGDELEPLAGRLDDGGVDPVGDRRGQDVAASHRIDQGLPAHGLV